MDQNLPLTWKTSTRSHGPLSIEQTHLKQEFFHKRSFRGVTIDEFTAMLDEYMVWYRDKRIKTEYGMSIMDKRIQLGLVA